MRLTANFSLEELTASGTAERMDINNTPDDVQLRIIESGIPYDQVICEYDSWVHISVPNEGGGTPRKNALIIDKEGVRLFA